VISCVEKRDVRSHEHPLFIATYAIMIPLKIYFTFLLYKYWMARRGEEKI